MSAFGGFVQDVDEKLLYDTFSAFGVIVTNPKVILAVFGMLCIILISLIMVFRMP
jgi:hypothetical protein